MIYLLILIILKYQYITRHSPLKEVVPCRSRRAAFRLSRPLEDGNSPSNLPLQHYKLTLILPHSTLQI